MKYLVLLLSLLAFNAYAADDVAKPEQTPVEDPEPECD
jgi:hypothetical protein